MNGEMNLNVLLKNMQPVLHGEYAFCLMNEDSVKTLPVTPLCSFHEEEGITIIMERAVADRLGLSYAYTGVLITLNVHSSLNAVGFLACVTSKLAEAGISVNAFSPIHHDHLFVSPEDAGRAMTLLEELSRETA